MRLSWHRSSRVEDRFESWITQQHQRRVLAGETTPSGPCPDEAFLRALARRVQKHCAVGSAGRSRGNVPQLHEPPAGAPAGAPIVRDGSWPGHLRAQRASSSLSDSLHGLVMRAKSSRRSHKPSRSLKLSISGMRPPIAASNQASCKLYCSLLRAYT